MRFAVIPVVRLEGKVLLVEEANGIWRLPGGHVGTDEGPETALLREAKEETGLDVRVERAITKTTRESDGLSIYWIACTSSGSPVPGGEVKNVKYVEYKQVPMYCTRETIKQWPEDVRGYIGLPRKY